MVIDCYVFGGDMSVKNDYNIPSCTITGKCRFIHNREDEHRVYKTHRDNLDKAKEYGWDKVREFSQANIPYANVEGE